ncbi:hypothetical protein MINTM018_52660 (plasmid) [Mycobacterium intracellulare]|uniref:Uncharacterized protein n=1 Tax=Mycobacterium intracellulare TaxID=1767 RepID=A0A7R7RRR5_MYCIT|nr:hypothetical protein MINTM018_52660 [Mycobacterium intracellulare]
MNSCRGSSFKCQECNRTLKVSNGRLSKDTVLAMDWFVTSDELYFCPNHKEKAFD